MNAAMKPLGALNAKPGNYGFGPARKFSGHSDYDSQRLENIKVFTATFYGKKKTSMCQDCAKMANV